MKSIASTFRLIKLDWQNASKLPEWTQHFNETCINGKSTMLDNFRTIFCDIVANAETSIFDLKF